MKAHRKDTRQPGASSARTATSGMSLLARTLDDILSAMPPSTHPPDFEHLLFTMSTATMAPAHLQHVRKIRDVLGLGPIVQLPTELLWKIFELLPQKDKGNFRRTSKSLCAAVKLPFAQTIPSRWRFIFTEQSLRGLANLSADEAFVSRCETLSFRAKRLGPVNVENNHSKPKHLEDNFLLEGHHIEMITKALHNFQAHGRTDITLELCNDWDLTPSENAFFYGKVMLLGPRRLERSAMHDTLSALGVAIERAGFTLKKSKLEASEDVHTVRAEDMFWKQIEPVPDLTIHALDESKIEISKSRSEVEISRHCISNGNPGFDSYFGPLDGASCSNLYRLITAGEYQNFIMNTIDTDYHRLEQFVSTSGAVSLELADIFFVFGSIRTRVSTRIDKATKLLETIKCMPRLQALKLRHLEDGHYGKFVSGQVHWQGQEEIHAGLDKVILTVKAWR